MDVTPGGTVKSPEAVNSCEPDCAQTNGTENAMVSKVKIFFIVYVLESFNNLYKIKINPYKYV
jgi:hypothetical protein